MAKKSLNIFIFLFLFLLLATNVIAATGVPRVPTGTPTMPGGIDLSNAWTMVKYFVSGKWLLEDRTGTTLLVTLRILLWAFLFAVVYGVLSFLAVGVGGGGGGGVPALQWARPNNIRITLSLVFSFIGIFFMPFETVVVIALQYSYVGAIILMFPIFGILGWMIYWSFQFDVDPGTGGNIPPGSWKIATRILAFLLLGFALYTLASMFNIIIDTVNGVIPKTKAESGLGPFLDPNARHGGSLSSLVSVPFLLYLLKRSKK